MGNVGYAIAKGLGASDEHAQTAGKVLKYTVGGGLAVAGIVTSMGLATPSVAVQVASTTAKSLSTVTQAYSALGSSQGRALDREHLDNLARETDKLTKGAKELDSDAEVATLKERMQDAEAAYTLATADQGLTGTALKAGGTMLGILNKLVMVTD